MIAKRVLCLVFAITYLLCSNVQGQQCNIIFISPTGNGTGTKASPASLAGGIALAGPGSQLWLAVGSYTLTTPITMPNNATLEGGFDPANNWQKINTQKTIINRTNANPQTNPDRLVAIECINITGFTVQDVTIKTANALGNGVTTYGIYLNGCSNYNISRCDVTAGNGSNGLPGLPGVNGVNGAPGTGGQNGDNNGGCCTGAGTGGSGSYPGSAAGGNGGAGGARGNGFPNGNSDPPGSPGQNGQGPGGGAAGIGGNGLCGTAVGCNDPSTQGQPGADGADGVNGGNGGPGTPSFGGGYFINATGQNGINGTNGSGGGGGGGGGSQGCLPHGFGFNNNGSGAGGGGGGEGGQGGTGATGGTGGGGSFAIFSWAGGVNARLKDTYTNSGIPGQGGIGGSPGGQGGNGGASGPGGNSCDTGDGGLGGQGGDGGDGGNGGNGNIGLSLPIYEDPLAIAMDQSDMRTPIEPVIKVQSTGCTYSDIIFSTTANGVVQWYFDGGAIPLQATGSSVTIQYTSLGRHTITMVLNGVPYIYTDFVGIFTDGSIYTPNIVASNDSVCVNGSLNFSSSYAAATNYEWHFSGGTNPLTYNGPGFQTLNGITFNSVGRYMVTLQTTSPCCGKSLIDTTYIDVIPFSTADVFVFSSATDICVNEPVDFGASPVFGGSNPQYTWLLNGGAVGTGNTYSNAGLQNGDVVTVRMASNYLCAQNNPATSLPVNMVVHQPPVINCSFVGQFLGGPTNFTANVGPGGTPNYTYTWNFGDGGISNQQNPSHNYGSTGNYTAVVTVTDGNGCTASCSSQVSISIAPQVNAAFTGNITAVGCGTGSVDFTDLSTGGAIQWSWDFGDGSTSNIQNPTHNFTTSGYFDITLVASNGVLADTLVLPNFIFIPPPPVADYIAVDSIQCEPYIFQFVDQSLGGVTQWSWNFGDGNTSILQNPKHTYATPGNYTVTLTVTTANGCTDTKTSINYIQYLPQPDPGFFTLDTAVCTGQTVSFTDTSKQANKWIYYFGDNTGPDANQNPTHVYTDPGTYTVTQIVQNGVGCSDTLVLTNLIRVVPFPIPQFTADPIKLQLPDTVVQFYNQSLYFDSLTWLLGNGDTAWIDNPVGIYSDSGTYMVSIIVTNVLGCTDTLEIPYRVIEQESFFIPNTFTPDEDYLNENFRVYGRGIVAGDIRIFNRWGEEVFNTPYVFVGWDGKDKNGKYVPEGVYSYLINITWFTGRQFERRGTITLLR